MLRLNPYAAGDAKDRYWRSARADLRPSDLTFIRCRLGRHVRKIQIDAAAHPADVQLSVDFVFELEFGAAGYLFHDDPALPQTRNANVQAAVDAGYIGGPVNLGDLNTATDTRHLNRPLDRADFDAAVDIPQHQIDLFREFERHNLAPVSKPIESGIVTAEPGQKLGVWETLPQPVQFRIPAQNQTGRRLFDDDLMIGDIRLRPRRTDDSHLRFVRV